MHWPRSRDPNNFVCLLKNRCGTADIIPRVAIDNCDRALLANDGFADPHDPAWFCAHSRWRAFFHGSRSKNFAWAMELVNCVVCAKYYSASLDPASVGTSSTESARGSSQKSLGMRKKDYLPGN